MTDQLAMFAPARPDWAPEGDPLSDAWWEFHQAHPQVYRELRRRALALVGQGHRHLGMKMLWEVARYDSLLDQPERSPYKLNNNHTPYFARLLMENERDLAGVFETRTIGRAA